MLSSCLSCNVHDFEVSCWSHTLKQYPKLCSKWGNEIKHFYENLDGLVMTKRGRGLRQRGDNPLHSNHIQFIQYIRNLSQLKSYSAFLMKI